MQIHSFTGSRLTFLFLFVTMGVFGQNITLKGKVVDAETDKPVEFANLGIVGSFLGTASDFNGDFELKVSEEFSSYPIRISAVGYQNKEMKVQDLVGDNNVVIRLFQQSYGIDQVEVMAESKRLYGILKTAANMISENYSPAYSSGVYMLQSVNGNQKSEFALDYSDAAGYGDRSFSNANDKRGYQVKEVRRNFSPQPLKEGMLGVDHLLDFDIVRVRGNVLDADFVDRYKLEMKEKTVIDGDSVVAIKYQLENPTFAETGDDNVSAYEGVIYISTRTFAVLRNELKVSSKGYYPGGRGTALSNGKPYSYTVKTNYRKINEDKWALSKIEYSAEGSTRLDMDWVVYDFKPYKGGEARRTYFTDKASDENFWKRFRIPQ